MPEKTGFAGKSVWITGASSGIGEEMAYIFAGRGAGIVISSNDEPNLERVQASCRERGFDVFALPLDLTDFESLEGKAAEAAKVFGPIDILVNNAGISHRSSVRDTSLDVLRRVMDIDFTGHAVLTRAVLTSMLDRKSGHIVVTSSLAGYMSFPTRAAYCAAKHAVIGFFNALRAEVWRDNVKVTIACPAGVRTGIGYSSLMGDGGKYGKTDPHIEAGMPPDVCARIIVDAVAAGKEEVRPGTFKQKMPVYIARIFPSVYSWLIKRVKSLG